MTTLIFDSQDERARQPVCNSNFTFTPFSKIITSCIDRSVSPRAHVGIWNHEWMAGRLDGWKKAGAFESHSVVSQSDLFTILRLICNSNDFMDRQKSF